MQQGKAVVVGGTGATGEHVVGCLLLSGYWANVVTVGRRPVNVPASYSPEQFKAKLEQVVINMDNLQTEAAAAFQGAHTVFCCLGTTRKQAGSAEQFKKVDLGYVQQTAEAAKAGGASHFSLLTAVGSNAKIWANDWLMFHSLLYMRTKGLAEEAVKAQAFPTTSIFRPGMLDRGDSARPIEKPFAKLMGMKVSDLAQLMVKDAEASASLPPVSVYEESDLKKAIKENRAPKMR